MGLVVVRSVFVVVTLDVSSSMGRVLKSGGMCILHIITWVR